MKKGKKDEDYPHFPTFFTFYPFYLLLLCFFFSFTLLLFYSLPFYLFPISYLNPIFRLKLSGFSL